MSGHVLQSRSKSALSLEGRKTAIWSKPGNLSNSELTITSKKKKSAPALDNSHLSSSSSTVGRRHAQRPLSTATLTDLGATLEDTLGTSSTGDMLRKSVTFDQDSLLKTTLDASSSGLKDFNDDTGINGSLTGSPFLSEDKPWFVRSDHHLYSQPSSSINNVDIDAPLGTVGAALASSLNLSDKTAAGNYGSVAAMAREFFPLTLNAATFAKSVDAPLQTNLHSPGYSAAGLPRPGSASSTGSMRPKRSKSPTRSKRNKPPRAVPTGQVAPPGLATQSLEKMYLRSVEAPVTATASIGGVTPFQAELARLRMERLKLEERHLLEIKRQEELEKIRGPQPKWYEMKGPEFHYEAHKNTELIKSQSEWQVLLDYRNKLLAASKDFSTRSSHVY